ncbi:hypothetical protein [Halochromatium sp.]
MRQPELVRTLVTINELGGVGLDHLLMSRFPRTPLSRCPAAASAAPSGAIWPVRSRMPTGASRAMASGSSTGSSSRPPGLPTRPRSYPP